MFGNTTEGAQGCRNGEGSRATGVRAGPAGQRRLHGVLCLPGDRRPLRKGTLAPSSPPCPLPCILEVVEREATIRGFSDPERE